LARPAIALTDSMERSISAAVVAAAPALSVIRRPLCATLWIDREVSSIEELFCSTIVPRLSVIAPTSSIDAAISLMALAVSSAAAARSSALPATLRTDVPISSSDVDDCSTALTKVPASSLRPLIPDAICAIDALTSSADVAMSAAVCATCPIDAAVWAIADAF
jgi:hypothetical protein